MNEKNTNPIVLSMDRKKIYNKTYSKLYVQQDQKMHLRDIKIIYLTWDQERNIFRSRAKILGAKLFISETDKKSKLTEEKTGIANQPKQR